jgi:hypothetical protein
LSRARPVREQRIEAFVDFLANSYQRSDAAAGRYAHDEA